tara:strand:+ start:339 stop:662 length:324 start_codon:yes stop_codon:yes gene_type:complete
MSKTKMTKKELDAFAKKEGYYHEQDPRHSMNSERTGPPSITIAVAIPKSKPKKIKNKENKKPEMMYGGMAGGKKHMYSGGGSVTDNAGLRALKKASPEAYNNITKGN